MTDILSQEEIDALLEVVEDDSYTKADDIDLEDTQNVTLYDFNRPNRVLKEYLCTLQKIHDNMASKLTIHMSSLLKTNVEMQILSVEQNSYNEFLMSIPSTTNLSIFSIQPFSGKCILEINPDIVFPMIDRLLGGCGDSFYSVRQLTDIEQNLLDGILEMIMQQLKESWRPVVEIYPSVQSKESNPDSIQLIGEDDAVVVVEIEMLIGNVCGMIKICYPMMNLEPIFAKLTNDDISISDINQSTKQELNELVSRTEVFSEVILGKADVSLETLLELEVGDIIKLDCSADESAIVSIDNKELFLAQIDVHKAKKSVKIDKLIKNEEDIHIFKKEQ